MIQIKIYVDFDGTTVNSVKKAISLYNEEYHDNIHWTDINTWGFKECTKASKSKMLKYFESPKFFENLEYMESSHECLLILHRLRHDITIVSRGTTKNLALKEKWITENLPFVKFIGVHSSTHGKSTVDLSDGILLDDNSQYLNSSNAKYKVCYGDIFAWNEDWDSTRCFNWTEFVEYVNKRVTL